MLLTLSYHVVSSKVTSNNKQMLLPENADTLLVRYGEIAVKSKRVRERMENKLIGNIKAQLETSGLKEYKIEREWGRIIIEIPERDVQLFVEVLKKVFGVTSVSPSIKVSLDTTSIIDTVVGVAIRVLKPWSTFAVRVRRANKQFPLTSKDLEKLLGEKVLERIPQAKVDLENPDVTIGVEVRLKNAFIYLSEEKGPGGLPYGVEGLVVSLVSGGVDSALATWMIMKRGCSVIPVHFDMRPFYGEDSRERLHDVLRWLSKWVPERNWSYYDIPLGMIHENIKINEKYRCLLCKMVMYKIAEKVAEIENAKAIVTGESLGQVATQTLDNLRILTSTTKTMILRPLIGFDKNEIEKKAMEIGLYEIASRKVSPCQLNPKLKGKYVITHASEKTIRVLIEAIRRSPYECLEEVVREALKQARKISVRN